MPAIAGVGLGWAEVWNWELNPGFPWVYIGRKLESGAELGLN